MKTSNNAQVTLFPDDHGVDEKPTRSLLDHSLKDDSGRTVNDERNRQ